MKYSKIQIDFVRRTSQNLAYVAQHGIETQKDFNEVTNLINNMLGLVCFPKEVKKKDYMRLDTPIPSTIQYQCRYGSVYLCLNSNGQKSKSLNEIIRHIRNSVCHGNFLQGTTNEQNEIEAIRFQDFYIKDNMLGQKNFDMIMSVPQLRIFVEDISKNYLVYV